MCGPVGPFTESMCRPKTVQLLRTFPLQPSGGRLDHPRNYDQIFVGKCLGKSARSETFLPCPFSARPTTHEWPGLALTSEWGHTGARREPMDPGRHHRV